MAAPTPSKARDPQVAVGPLNSIAPDDIGSSAARIDAWLRKTSDGAVTLERLPIVAGNLPVAGNVMALAGAVDAIVATIDQAPTSSILAGLGIDLIAAGPNPAETVAARTSLRPMLMLAQQELQQDPRKPLGNAFVETIVGHLNATIAGEIDDFVKQAQSKLADMLSDAGKLGAAIIEQLILGLTPGNQGTASNVRATSRLPLYDPSSTLDNIFSALWKMYRSSGKPSRGAATPAMTPATAQQRRAATTAKLQQLGIALPVQLSAQADSATAQTIGWLLAQIAAAVAIWRKRNGGQAANVHTSKTSQAKHVAHEGELGAVTSQADAEGGPGCANCPAPSGTGQSISFATGDETLTHTDFVLPSLFPIEWTRTYRSRLGAYDSSEQGARWITPYTTRFDVITEQGIESVLYHAADGRSHAYPLPEVGKFHHDPIESVTLVRVSEHRLTLAHGFDSQEAYQRHGQSFRLTSITLRSGAGIALHYNHRIGERTVLSDIIAYQGQTTLAHVGIRLDDAGRIAEHWQIEDGQLVRQLSRYTYDEAGDLVMAQDENAAHWDYTYQHHLVTRYTDRTGRGMNLQWNGEGPHAKAIREWADDGSFDTRLEWDENIRLTYVTDALGHETRHYYDILGYTYRIKHPDGRSEWFFRDDAKNVIQHIHTDGSIDRFTYDDRGNLVEHLRADDSTIHYAYDDHDQLIKIRDAEGGLWQRDYDTKGNLTEEVDPLGNKTEYAYNKAGLLTEITDAKGGKKQLGYNAASQLTSYTDCSGKTTTWQYDPRGRLEKVTNAAGGVTRYEYEAGQLAKVIHPDETAERFERDAEGRLLAHTDALHRRTTWDYSEAGLIARHTDAAHGVLEYQWNKLGRLTGLTNENARQIRFQYDPVGRLLKQTGFDGNATQYYYDAASGVLKTTVDAETLATGYTFDALGRLTQRGAGILDPKTNKYETKQTETFAYDGNGRLVLAENAHSRLQWFHDAAGNVIREHQHYSGLDSPRVAVWRHAYDELNQRVSTIRPDGHRIDLLTYGSGHVHGIQLDGQELASFERDDLHRETQRTQGNRLTQTQKYDTAGRLLEQTLSHLDRTTAYVNRRQYRYDAVGQLTGINDTRRGNLTYRYDPVGKLLEAHSALGQETFDFDPAGNLLDDPTLRTFAADPATGRPETSSRLQGRAALVDNLLKQYAGTHYEWSARGNLLKRTVNGQTAQFSWDLFNRLTRYSDDRLSVRYQYDALGRRITKHAQAVYFEPLGAGSVYIHNERARVNKELGCGFTLYGWDGDTLAWEARRDADIMRQGAYHPSPGSTRTTHYLYEPNSFVPIAQGVTHGMLPLHKQPAYAEADYDIDEDPLWQHEIQPTPFDSLAWYQCDHLGTPQELTDQNGEIAWSAHYKAWGAAQEVITDVARKAGIQNPIRFQGQYFDHETGLHYNRHRYYDPSSGRFISKDPIGLAGGLNAHEYAPNPVSWIDPRGLQNAHQRRVQARINSRQMALNEQTARMASQPGYPLDVAADALNPNKKPWDAMSPYDYTQYCRQWSRPKSTCEPEDRVPGRDVKHPEDYVPARDWPTSEIPSGYKCDARDYFPELRKRGTAPTADYNDFIDTINKMRANTRGVRR
ncbi:RHS repeat-associated core domain-containing protein [Ralstonia wenshanensis]|uniref:RHS repeat-associated core domain-containing protein n=1 Tax=Ralstonia wenshanensis TaxID=2842456 RepID=UPI0021B1F57B|nr:RHS repeat-associated core domain-containing protein [Ralstonia wenshanensis]MCT7304625.1 RHS domain-containing protein [Ralstonia wenshanensis]